MKHKHAELIKEWADGAEIEVFNDRRMCWEDITGDPYWVNSFQYRIKPEPKPDWSKYVRIESQNNQICSWDLCLPKFANLRITFDGETGALKSAEVI